jgi:cyanuric acid amidohydrolase
LLIAVAFLSCDIMAHINILKYGVSSPADTSPLKELKAAGYESNDILAVIGKSEGKYCTPVLGISLIS